MLPGQPAPISTRTARRTPSARFSRPGPWSKSAGSSRSTSTSRSRSIRRPARYFPASNRSRMVLDALLGAAAAARRRLAARRQSDRARARRTGGWLARAAGIGRAGRRKPGRAGDGRALRSGTGSDGAGLRIAQSLGHTLVPTYPALTPLTTSEAAHKALAGVSLTATASARPARTGRGCKVRPAVFSSRTGGTVGLQCSTSRTSPCGRRSSAGRGRPCSFSGDGSPPASGRARCKRPAGPCLAWSGGSCPSGWQRAARRDRPGRRRYGAVAAGGPAEARRGTDALPAAVVGTRRLPGGRSDGRGWQLGEINPASMESKIAPGLFLCGEILDAFGPIGGYNFLWAWITGKIAGEAAGRK